MMHSAAPRPALRGRPRLTLRGITVLVATFLIAGPPSAYGIGIPLAMLSSGVEQLVFGRPSESWGGVDHLFLPNLLLIPVTAVVALPLYGVWADLHLWPMALWIVGDVIVLATSRRGVRVGDAALVAAAAVLVFPAVVDPDGPSITWTYPDAVYMAGAAAAGAALCTAFVRGFGAAGLRRRVAWGWLVRGGDAAAA